MAFGLGFIRLPGSTMAGLVIMLIIPKSPRHAVPSLVIKMFPWAERALAYVSSREPAQYSLGGYCRAQCPVNVDIRDHKQLVRATKDEVSDASTGVVMSTYQMQSVDLPIFPGVLDDVPVRQPRADEAEPE